MPFAAVETMYAPAASLKSLNGKTPAHPYLRIVVHFLALDKRFLQCEQAEEFSFFVMGVHLPPRAFSYFKRLSKW